MSEPKLISIAEHLEEAYAEIARLDAVLNEYKAIGERIAAQDGNWLMLHRGAMDWLHSEFERLKQRLKQGRQAAKEVIE